MPANRKLSPDTNSFKKVINTGELDCFAVEDLLSQVERVTEIILKNNKLLDNEVKSLEKLRKDIKENFLVEKLSKGSDKEEWNKLLDLDNYHTWLDDFHHGLRISYFHRLLLEKVNYFVTKNDPYIKLKRTALKDFICNFKKNKVENLCFDEVLDGMLWGNKFDLVPPLISDKKELIHDDRKRLKKFLTEGTLNRIDILADNVGQELFFDLLFACYVLDNKITNKVIFHLKNYPYNISDATKDDFNDLVKELLKTTQLKRFGSMVDKNIKKGRIEAITYPFTTLGYDRNNAINVSKSIYHKSSLIVTKGDFNYRKNVGWYYWKMSDSYRDAISYLKSPLLCFRTIKNEVLLGINNSTEIKRLNKKDPQWWKKGIGGVILFEYPNKDRIDPTGRINDYWNEII